VDAVLRHYTSSRRDAPDAHLLRRAALSAEFALAQYLVKGLAAGDQTMIGEAEEMLASLADDIAEHGGQPISVEPLPQAVPAVHVEPVPQAGPAVHVEPVPQVEPASAAAMPSVHVTPIPVEKTADADAAAPEENAPEQKAPAEKAPAAAGTPPAPAAADDTSTAALKIVDAKSH
jgi:macrolide phosphotransferase